MLSGSSRGKTHKIEWLVNFVFGSLCNNLSRLTLKTLKLTSTDGSDSGNQERLH